MELLFSAGMYFCSVDLNDPSPSLVSSRLSDYDVDLGVDDQVTLVSLFIYPDRCVPVVLATSEQRLWRSMTAFTLYVK
jgi:hypothetical protein